MCAGIIITNDIITVAYFSFSTAFIIRKQFKLDHGEWMLKGNIKHEVWEISLRSLMSERDKINCLCIKYQRGILIYIDVYKLRNYNCLFVSALT